MTTETIQTLTQVIKDYQEKNALLSETLDTYKKLYLEADQEAGKYKESAKNWLDQWRGKAQEAKEMESQIAELQEVNQSDKTLIKALSKSRQYWMDRADTLKKERNTDHETNQH